MTDLTRAIAEALGCELMTDDEGVDHCGPHNDLHPDHEWPCPEATRIAAALVPLIVQREQRAFDRGYDKAMEGKSRGCDDV